jgi:hypothetical protein
VAVITASGDLLTARFIIIRNLARFLLTFAL